MVNPSNTSPLVSLTLLGGFTLRVGGREVASIPRKARALLAYLSLQDGKPVSRETISDLLWTDRGVDQARHSLRQTLLVLRRELRDAGEDLIRSEDGVLSFRPDAVATDVGRFRVLAGSRERADLAEAAELYAGPLLARFQPVAADFDDWVDRTRGEIAEVSLDVLGRLADCCLAAEDAHAAVLTTERMLAIDPLREDVHRRLIEAYARVGRRADAIRQYNACVEMLRRDLDVGPSAETEALIGRVRGEPGGSVRSGTLIERDEVRVRVYPQATLGPPWVAVLPFRALGPNPVPEYFASGLVEDIITLLATVKEPVVISSNSSRVYADRSLDLQTIGRQLGTRYIVSGSCRHANPWLRISVELGEADNGTVLWAQSYDTKDAMLFDAQDHIARRVVNTIIPHIHGSELRRIRHTPPESMTAYDLLLQARELMFRLDKASYEEAGVLLRKAEALDRDYAPIHALLSDWFALRVGQGWSSDPDGDGVKSDAAAQHAIGRDPVNAQALSLHAHTRAFLHRDYTGAVRLFEKALDCSPNDASSWMWSAGTYAYIDQGAEAVERAERAIRLSPRDRFAFRYYTALSLSHYTNGSYEEAVYWGHQAINASPGYTASLRFTIASLSASGQMEQAREMARALMQIQPDFRVRSVRERHPYRDTDRRDRIANELVLAGLPE